MAWYSRFCLYAIVILCRIWLLIPVLLFVCISLINRKENIIICISTDRVESNSTSLPLFYDPAKPPVNVDTGLFALLRVFFQGRECQF